MHRCRLWLAGVVVVVHRCRLRLACASSTCRNVKINKHRCRLRKLDLQKMDKIADGVVSRAHTGARMGTRGKQKREKTTA